MSKQFKRLFALLLILAMVMSILPTAFAAGASISGRGDASRVYTDADSAILDNDVFAKIADVTSGAATRMGGVSSMTEANYIALLPQVVEAIEASDTYVPGTLQQNGNFLVWQTTTGMPCCYDPRMEAELHNTADAPSAQEIAKVEAEAILKDFPGAVICCVDSINACLGEGIVAIKAASLRDDGKSAKEIEAALLPIRNNVNQFVTVHNLNALKAAGRVTGSSAFFGNLLGVKPIIISDKVGNNTPIKKAKGRLNSLKELVALTAEGVEGIDNPTIYIAHADCEEEAKDVAEMIKESIPGARTYITYIGPIIGASIGADAIGLFSYGKSIERFAV